MKMKSLLSTIVTLTSFILVLFACEKKNKASFPLPKEGTFELTGNIYNEEEWGKKASETLKKMKESGLSLSGDGLDLNLSEYAMGFDISNTLKKNWKQNEATSGQCSKLYDYNTAAILPEVFFRVYVTEDGKITEDSIEKGLKKLIDSSDISVKVTKEKKTDNEAFVYRVREEGENKEGEKNYAEVMFIGRSSEKILEVMMYPLDEKLKGNFRIIMNLDGSGFVIKLYEDKNIVMHLSSSKGKFDLSETIKKDGKVEGKIKVEVNPDGLHYIQTKTDEAPKKAADIQFDGRKILSCTPTST